MEEVEKYTLLWDLPQGYGNNYNHPYWKEIVETLRAALIDRGLQPGHEVLDIGGGDRRVEDWFDNNDGVFYTSLDIAPNSGADIIDDITQWYVDGEDCFDYAISIDVMEHIPTNLIDDALGNIRVSVRHSVAFLISTRPDRGGKKIGQTLHMTVREPDWWVRKMFKYWATVKLLRVLPGEYCLIVVSP